MRIATWNCQGGLDKKLDVIEALNANILVVQECVQDNALASTEGISSAWSPPYEGATKGSGVFARNGWSITTLPRRDDLPWVFPVTIRNEGDMNEVTLLAVWTNKNRNDGRPSYADQFGSVLDAYGPLLTSGRTIIAGDLNASMQGPSSEEHAHNLATVESLGLVSTYHHANGIDHGNESDMTLKWIGQGRQEWFYHCDFIFVPTSMSTDITCQVMPTFEWERRVSDHQPVVAHLRSL